MIAHDEGMMDEGAASLRDRDMIARRRGGPFVHRCSLRVRLFSFCLSRERVLPPPPPPPRLALRPILRPRRVARVCRVHQGTRPNAPLSPSSSDSRCRVRRTRLQEKRAVRPLMPMSRLLTRRRLTFRRLHSRKNIVYATATIWQRRDCRGHFSELAREVDLASLHLKRLWTF